MQSRIQQSQGLTWPSLASHAPTLSTPCYLLLFGLRLAHPGRVFHLTWLVGRNGSRRSCFPQLWVVICRNLKWDKLAWSLLFARCRLVFHGRQLEKPVSAGLNSFVDQEYQTSCTASFGSCRIRPGTPIKLPPHFGLWRAQRPRNNRAWTRRKVFSGVRGVSMPFRIPLTGICRDGM